MRPIHTSSYPTPGAETSEIAGVSVCKGDHVVLNLSPFPQPIEGQVTDLNQEYIEINKVPYQRRACISVTQLDLTNGINFVNLIKHLENSPEAFLDAFEISQGDVFTCLKAVRNSLEIQITLFNALEIPNFSPLDNLKSLEVLLVIE